MNPGLRLKLIVHFLHNFRILHRMKQQSRDRLHPGKGYTQRLGAILLLAALFLSSCLNDVPHDNPLDPAQGRTGFEVSGVVQTYYAPHMPIDGALVWLKPGTYIGLSAADGTFRIQGIEAGDYTIYCSSDRFQKDSLHLQVFANTSLNFTLNGLPHFVSHSVTTHYIARWFPLEDVYYLQVTAEVNDPDGLADLKGVRCEIPYTAFADTLDPDSKAGRFKKNIFNKSLNITSLQDLLGYPVYLTAEDKPGATVHSEGLYPARVIEKTAVLLSPVELESVPADSIHFRWDLTPLPFEYNLRIDIYAINAGIATSVETIDGISNQQTDWLYRSTLPAGDYFWTLTIQDTFGNSSQSREGVFQIL